MIVCDEWGFLYVGSFRKVHEILRDVGSSGKILMSRWLKQLTCKGMVAHNARHKWMT